MCCINEMRTRMSSVWFSNVTYIHVYDFQEKLAKGFEYVTEKGTTLSNYY